MRRYLWLILLLALPSRSDVSETLGPLKLQMSQAAVSKTLGAPASQGKPVLEAATGLTIVELRYPARGLTLEMGREKPSEPWHLERLHAVAPCKYKTSRGVGIGDSLDRIRVAYTLGGEDGPTDTVAVNEYGGLIFHLKKGTVTEVYLGYVPE